jgi:predicted flap endonuclease-1-like 5' DNA nuclease
MPIPPATTIIEQFVPDIMQTDYSGLVTGIINGIIYGFIIWLIFSIVKIVYDRMYGKKETVVRVETTTKVEVAPSAPKVTRIEGIGTAYSRKLSAEGITTTEELLEAGATKKGRKELSDKTGISENVILEWVNRADLFRITGIGEEYSDLLKEAGVSTVVDLSRRNPENLHKTLVGVNDAKKLVKRPPSLNQTTDWVEQAKILPRKVEY